MNRLALLAVVAPGVAVAQVSTFQGIGDIAGGPFASAALAISGDGQVVVGYSMGASNRVPVRWAAATGIQSIEPAPPGQRHWTATAASTNGSVIVGFSEQGSDHRAFRWTAAGGMQDL